MQEIYKYEIFEKEFYKLNIMKENIDWFSKYKIKCNIHINEDDQLWFESIIGNEDFKTKIITKYRLKKLKRIL